MQNLVLTIYVLQFIESFSCIVTDIESRKLLQHQSDIPWKHLHSSTRGIMDTCIHPQTCPQDQPLKCKESQILHARPISPNYKASPILLAHPVRVIRSSLRAISDIPSHRNALRICLQLQHHWLRCQLHGQVYCKYENTQVDSSIRKGAFPGMSPTHVLNVFKATVMSVEAGRYPLLTVHSVWSHQLNNMSSVTYNPTLKLNKNLNKYI